ncbi:hypothetical protein HYH02_015063 [Chlamydomonas schloesseri]|uniref:FAD-binding FR-type domain-containing protein n=1 Tax=Chlamydomonas schloesseri TaxID=2026947 RepID=A0A835SMT4_9CHLO|nr:hypothetical protein HYH02_015063 [Chlamydomonas schloesseri]|eukprot:KAG2425119.1 hypothetical protein HYH02_015063 [Chlamydomonas schloesseri]
MQHTLMRANSYPAGAACSGRASQRRTQPVTVCSAASRSLQYGTGPLRGSSACGASGRLPAPFSSAAAAARRAAAGRRGAVRVQANWGAPVEFQPAKVVSNSPAAAGPLHKVVIDVGAPLAAGYTVPGQFVQVKVGDSKPGFFAIASAPGAHAGTGQLEFLIKSAPGSTAELLCNAKAGDGVSVSPVMGKGFPLDRLPASTTRAVLLFATGSGISPLRAVIDSGALAGRDVTLYYGTRNQESTAYRELLPQWEAAGVKVVPVYSESKQGYVHDVFEREGLAALPSDAASSVGALLCGHKGMCQAVTALLTAKGVPPEKILLNF